MGENVIALATLVIFLVASLLTHAQTPLTGKRFDYNNLPYKVDTDTSGRGPQFGYNLCNSTTEGATSLCQTAMLNSLDDFCLWGPPTPNSLIGNTEAQVVAWCTRPGRGTRTIPQGALTGVQLMKTSAYVQITGIIKQELINIDVGDFGGQLDPHAADRRGSPIGGLMFSNAFASNNGNNNSYQQVIEWNSFIGAATFCLKACDPAGADAARFCDHVYDQLGCAYNSPAAYKNNTFESCEGENQDFVGVYTSNGQVLTFTQPINSPITAMPYVPKIPASSNCATFQSTDLYNKPSSVAGDSSHGSDSNGGVAYLPVLSAAFILPGILAFLFFICP